MASCYGRISAPSTGTLNVLEYLPMRTVLLDGTRLEIDFFRERYGLYIMIRECCMFCSAECV